MTQSIRRIVHLLAIVVVGWSLLPQSTAAQTTGNLQIIGTRLARDADFSGNTDWTNRGAPPRQDIGGRLQIYLRNTSAAPVQVNEIAINGRTFGQLTTQAIPKSPVADSKWWRVWPNPIPPSKVALISVRLVNLAADLPAGALFEVRTAQGNIVFSAPQFQPQPSNLWIPALNFADDLNTTTLFVGNRGSAPITLKSSGGLRINGGAELSDATVPQTTLAPGEVAPIIVRGTASALTRGEQAVFQVVAQSGGTAFGSVRVFPYRFTVQSQMQGSGYDAADRARHFVGDWAASRLLYDEPLGHGLSPMQVVKGVNDYLNADPQNQQIQVEIHNTSYAEGQIYDDIADIDNTHWGNTRQDLATYQTWPKPNWYMPQDSWGRNEGLYEQEDWYPLEDLQLQAFQAVGRGAKSIQWFLFQNHWEQGWGRKSGTDFGRIYQDLYRSGHIGNPLLWNQIGRVSGVLHVAEPYLSYSAHHTGGVQNGLQIDSVVSVNHDRGGAYNALVTVIDARTPREAHAGYLFRSGVPQFEQQTLYNQLISVGMPAFAYNAVDRAYSIDPLNGVQEISFQKAGDNTVQLIVPEVRVGALIVLGTQADGAFLQARWAEVQQSFTTYADIRPTLLADAADHHQGVWRSPAHAYRKRVTVTNSGTQPAATLALPLDLALERRFDPSTFQVVEERGGEVAQVPFFVQPRMVYEDFESSDVVARLTVSPCATATVPQTCSLSVEASNGAVALNSVVTPQTYQWRVSIAEPQPWRASFPSNAIPADRFSQLSLEAQLSTFPFANQIYVTFLLNADSDGNYEKGRAFPLRDEADLWEDIGGGWIRSTFDLHRVFQQFYPGERPRGQFTINFMTQIPENSTLSGTFPWSVRNIEVVGGRTATVQASTPLAPGESRTYELYYNVQQNDASPAATFAPDLANAAPASDISVVTATEEHAGATLQITGASANITTNADVVAAVLRHYSPDGALVSSQTLSGSRSFSANLARAPQPGDLFTVIPVQPSGEGETFVFAWNGAPLSGHVPQAQVVPAQWALKLQELKTDGTSVVPFSTDLSTDGTLVALGAARVNDDRSDTAGIVQVRGNDGALRWEKTYDGRVFYVRFAPDGQALYVAANLGPDQIDSDALYTNVHIIKYDLAGAEQWRHKVGSGTPIPAAQQGRTVLDMQVYPNGDVLYSEWNTFGVHLDGKTGKVVWAADTGFGQVRYTPRVVPLQDGGAVLVSFESKCVDGQGNVVASVVLGGEAEYAAAATKSCAQWAVAGSNVRVISKQGVQQISNPGAGDYAGDGTYVGRTPRTLAFSADGKHLAAGTADGTFSLMDSAGKLLWQKRDAASYVTQVAFLPNNAGVVFAREIFDYQHDVVNDLHNGWRFRDTVEAYDLAGNLLWRHEGGWRTSEPFMTQFALSADSTRLVVLAGEDMRAVDVQAAPVSNAALYPVENGGLAGGGARTFLPLVHR